MTYNQILALYKKGPSELSDTMLWDMKESTSLNIRFMEESGMHGIQPYMELFNILEQVEAELDWRDR